jgi:cation:H+ antiporter
MISPAVMAWSQFAVCAVAIGIAGTLLSRYGDIIADKTGLGGTWIGLILLATVTSLPELVTGVSAVTLADAPDIAIGNVLGACVINLTMIVVLDLLYRRESIFTRASQGHILSAGFGVMLVGFVGINVLITNHGGLPALGHVGLNTPVIVLMYVVAMRTVFRYEKARMAEYTEERVERYPHMTLRQAGIRYALASLAVVGVGLWLPYVAQDLAAAMGWGTTFVGTLFVALATTLPEMAVTIGALRLGALDMAIGNLLGSNLFNIAIVAIDDVVFLRGPILAHVSPLHAVSAMSAAIMSGVAVVGLLYRPRTRLYGTIGWASLTLLSLYLLNSYVLYLYGQ